MLAPEPYSDTPTVRVGYVAWMPSAHGPKSVTTPLYQPKYSLKSINFVMKVDGSLLLVFAAAVEGRVTSCCATICARLVIRLSGLGPACSVISLYTLQHTTEG